MYAHQQHLHLPALLAERRGKVSKSATADTLEVSRLTYSMWEKGAWIPGDDYAQRLSDYLDYPLPDIVWCLYLARMAANVTKGVSLLLAA